VQDTTLTQIADALGSFNQGLTKWGTYAQHSARKQQAETEAAYANKMIAGMTRDEAIKHVEDGTMPNFADPFARGIVDKNAGQAYGERIVSGIQNQIKSGQIDLTDEKLDIGTVITEATKAELQNIPQSLQGSKAGMAGLQQRVESARDALMQQQLVQRQAAFTSKQEGVAYDQFNRMFDNTAGAPADIVQNKLRGVYQDIGNGKFLKNDQLDAQLINVMRNRASDPNYVEAVVHGLTVDRVGADGTKVPALGANPRYAQDVQQIRDLARDTLAKKFDADTQNRAVENTTEALKRQDGSFWTLTNQVYKNPYTKQDPTRTISADDVKKKAVDQYLTWSQQTQQNRKEDGEVRFQRDWSVLTTNNLPNPAWKETLEGPPKAFANPQALANPQTRQSAIAAGEQFMRMTEANYPYVKNTLGLGKDTMDFYQVYNAARTALGKTPDQALDWAAAASRTPDNENDLAVRSQRAKDVEQKVKSIDFSTSWASYLPFNNSDAKNTGALQKRVLDAAVLYTRVPGMSLDDAVKAAVDTVQKHSMYVNGHVVQDNGQLPPPQMKPLIEDYLTQFHKDHGTANHVARPTDLSIEPYGGGTFRIIDGSQEGGMPLYVKNDKGQVAPALITMPMLQAMQQKKDGDKALDVQKVQQDAVQSAVQSEQNTLRSTPDRLLSPQKREQKKALGPDPVLEGISQLNDPSSGMVGPTAFDGLFDKLLHPRNSRMGK
jgi:hypothetical protein